MELKVTRNWKKADYTIGRLFINGEFFCNTLEDTDRGLTTDTSLAEIKSRKVYGQTAIPTGTYYITITYSPKFRKRLPLINHVPGFDGIRIHSGNTAADSLGCILLGKNTKPGMVLDSRATCEKFMRLLDAALSRKETIVITIA